VVTSRGPRYVCPADYPALDQIGRGQQIQDAEVSDPLYMWNNTFNGDPATEADPGAPVDAAVAQCGDPTYVATDIIKPGRDYFMSSTLPAGVCPDVPYTCPHPLTGLTGRCDSTAAGTTGYDLPQ
jgi:hypothetical protein